MPSGRPGCAGPAHRTPSTPLHYVGSSTVAVFLRDAEAAHGAVQLTLDTGPESDGGEANEY